MNFCTNRYSHGKSSKGILSVTKSNNPSILGKYFLFIHYPNVA